MQSYKINQKNKKILVKNEILTSDFQFRFSFSKNLN